MQKPLFLFLFCCLFIPPWSANAEQTRLFLEAEKAAKLNRKSTYKELTAQLQGYPLLPYLEAIYFENNFSLKYQAQIEGFLARHETAPFSKDLRLKWLNYLAKHRIRKPFLNAFKDYGKPKLTCLDLSWRLQGERDEKAQSDIWAEVTQLWVSPTSLPRECDPLFKRWKQAGSLTSDIALQRYILAAKAKNYRLLPYLKRLLSTSDKHIANMWRTVVSRPSNVYKDNFFLLYNKKEADVLLYALNKQAFSNPTKVNKLWQQAKTEFKFDTKQGIELDKKIALAFATQNHHDALKWLNNLPDEAVDDAIKQWRLAYTLDNLDWQATLDIVSNLPEQMQTDLGVAYWKARALEHLGESAWANEVYQELSERRSYYGFLAAGKLGKPVTLRHEPLSVDQQLRQKIGSIPEMQRALELFKLNRTNAARREWNVLLTRLSEPEQLIAAKVAYDKGWYSRAIFTLPKVGYLNDVNLRFPLAYKQLVFNAALQQKLDPAFVFAITRRESSFMHDAFSPVGAAGLMQIKPSTASYVAQKKVYKTDLFQPERNVNLGSHYLSQLLNQSNGNPIIATASYNAGFSNVKRWLPDEAVPADVWIETIPYKETRNYVKAVVAYSKVYQQLLHRNANLFDGIADLAITPEL